MIEQLRPTKLLRLTENNSVEKNFNTILQQNNKIQVRTSIGVLIIYYFLLTMFQATLKTYYPIKGQNVIYSLRAIFLVLIIFVFFFENLAYQFRIFKNIYVGIFILGTIPIALQSYYVEQTDFRVVEMQEQLVLLITAAFITIFDFIDVLLLGVVQTAEYFTVYGLKDDITLNYTFFWCISVIFIFVKKFNLIQNNIHTFNNLQRTLYQKKQYVQIVSQLLPKHMLQKMSSIGSLNNKLELTDQFDNVTILFADISGFTAYSNQVQSPKQVVKLLRELFEGFDKQCLKFQVYKMYTIGDCYVVLGLNQTFNRTPEIIQKECKNVVGMGLKMIEIIEDVRKKIFDGLGMRIGVHTGSTIGGIIGTDIVRYDIYGKDCLIANKMESNGVKGRLMVSEATKQVLERDKDCQYTFDFHKEVEIDKYVEEGQPKHIKAYLVS